MFIAALFKIDKIGKQPKHPSTDEGIKKTHTHTHTHWNITQLYKKKKIMLLAATWMDLGVITLNEVSQQKTNILWYHFYVNQKNYTNELIYKTEIDSHT